MTEINRPEAVSLSVAIIACINDREGDVAEKTLRRYKEGLAHFERYAGADTPLHEALAAKTVKPFRPFRRKEKAAKETVNNDLGAVSVLATYCLDQGWISERPRIKKFKSKVRIRDLEPDQPILYMANVRRSFRLLWSQGARL